MKINMAEGEYFTPGMIVSCTTCHGLKIQGEVMAFDLGTKIIALSILLKRFYVSKWANTMAIPRVAVTITNFIELNFVDLAYKLRVQVSDGHMFDTIVMF